MLPFSALLARHLERRGLTQTEFATKVGVAKTTISNAVLGSHVPRWDRHAHWCEVLDLSGEDKEVFLDAWGLAIAPARIAALVSRLEKLARAR